MEEANEAVEFQHDPEFLSQVVPLMEIYGRYFDSEVRGVERFPDSGPVLLVGNHSGPNSDPDTPALMAAWYRKNGVENPLVVLSFDVIFAVPRIGDLFRRLAQVPANHRNAEAALDRGAAVLVYPGGLEDIARPWTDPRRGPRGARIEHRAHARTPHREGSRSEQIPNVQHAAGVHDSVGRGARPCSLYSDSRQGHDAGL
jgi:hypothetical protein